MLDRYSPKDPNEVLILSMNFVDLVNGETITACVVDVFRSDGSTEDTSGMVVGNADISAAPVIKQKIQAGVHGHEYVVRFKATTATRTIVASAAMLARNGA